MKTGIITFHETTNFGSTLQAFALYKAMEKLGCECEIIDYKCEAIVNKELPQKFSLRMPLKQIVKHILYGQDIARKFFSLMEFLNKEAVLSPTYTKRNITEARERYDKIFVGSDIVWGLDITKIDTTYFLDFVNTKSKKYAFSSSVGNPWSEQEKKIVKPLLNDFQNIAVRENESAEWVGALTNKNIPVVCDPTMLLTAEEWLKYKSEKYKGKKYILAYFDNDNQDCVKSANLLAKQLGCDAIFINYGRPFKGVKSVRPHSIEDFFSLIYYAEKIVTASYHGMLFSIYFNKQFVYYNRAHKSRMNTLAAKLGVTGCSGEGKDVRLIEDIDYNIVNPIVKQFRHSSLKILKGYIDE